MEGDGATSSTSEQELIMQDPPIKKIPRQYDLSALGEFPFYVEDLSMISLQSKNYWSGSTPRLIQSTPICSQFETDEASM